MAELEKSKQLTALTIWLLVFSDPSTFLKDSLTGAPTPDSPIGIHLGMSSGTVEPYSDGMAGTPGVPGVGRRVSACAIQFSLEPAVEVHDPIAPEVGTLSSSAEMVKSWPMVLFCWCSYCSFVLFGCDIDVSFSWAKKATSRALSLGVEKPGAVWAVPVPTAAAPTASSGVVVFTWL